MLLLALGLLSPMEWITNRDYPDIALQRHHDGPVKVQFMYDLDGRAFDCKVVASSGWPELDQTTCDIVVRRGRLKPFVDEQRQAIGAVGRLTYVWTLPGEQVRIPSPPSPDFELEVTILPKDMKRPLGQFALVISTEGKAESCVVWEGQGTGSAALDRIACDTLAKDSFSPRRDPAGKPMRYLLQQDVVFRKSAAAEVGARP